MKKYSIKKVSYELALEEERQPTVSNQERQAQLTLASQEEIPFIFNGVKEKSSTVW